VIDKDSGQVEEITLSYVVIKLWDLRRLILPTDHFTNKGVVNLTRNSTELVGAILIYVDYKLQVDVLRKKFYEILEESTLWDKKTSAFQVSDLKEQSVEIRALVSARNSGDLWNLRCEIREKLLSFIVENFPQNLPKAWPLLMNPA
jgi:small-conductance mechanosensitive channel